MIRCYPTIKAAVAVEQKHRGIHPIGRSIQDSVEIGCITLEHPPAWFESAAPSKKFFETTVRSA